MMKSISEVIEKNAKALSTHNSDYIKRRNCAPPTVEPISEVVKLVSEVIFPEYLGEQIATYDVIKGQVATDLYRIYTLLCDQIDRALRFENDCAVAKNSEQKAAEFVDSINDLRTLLLSDVDAIFKADPAASSNTEIILCYPSIVAMIHHRVAHRLLELEVPIIPRIISEIAHSKTGIDIHPGATIGQYFAIDHGTGVVIGETSIIGENVVIYQGVTLGAKGFRYDDNGNAINIPRHPIIEDNVKIYSNSSILGRITIGHDAIIGGNMWIDQDVEPYSKMIQQR
ncbi:MAG: serine O-acetyltransferase EpsC [Rikenellaceae bacterium]